MPAFSRFSVLIYCAICFMLTSTVYAIHMSDDSADTRTRPIGQVRIAAIESITSTPAPVRSGDAIYNSSCIACHSTGIANAPKAGDSARWTTLMEAGVEALIASAKQGKNAMPPMGTCADCSDEEMKNAIMFMVEMGN